ncbi:MAG: MotA/TolQ/ExbB proton channel family protein [Thermoguttaceae bacterium]
MKKTTSFFTQIITSPLLLGGLLSFGFYAAIHKGIIEHPLVIRYFTGHPVEYITAAMFFVGIASLSYKYLWVQGQRGSLRPVLGSRSVSKRPLSLIQTDFDALSAHEKKYGASFLTRRIELGLQFLHREGRADQLDSELRYLADEDANKADADYGFVGLILWAVPMLGFLGTVIGITMALGNLNLNAINESSQLLSAGLSVAFDTTALAIALDVVLYFVKFVVYRDESLFLSEVERLVDDELRGRFELASNRSESTDVVAVRNMFETVSESIKQLMSRQAEMLEQSLSLANRRFADITGKSTETLTNSFRLAMEESLTKHAASICETEKAILGLSEGTTLKFCDAIQRQTKEMVALQESTTKQTAMIREVVGAGEHLIKLEEQLHHNLSTLAQVGHFEETVNSLAAAIHLLNGKHHFPDFRNKAS